MAQFTAHIRSPSETSSTIALCSANPGRQVAAAVVHIDQW